MLVESTGLDSFVLIHINRAIGGFFLLAGIARFIGGISFPNKATFNCAVLSFVVEVVFHAIEVYRGTMTLQDTRPVFIICGVGTLALLLSAPSSKSTAAKRS